MIDGNWVLTENCTITLLPDKPQFTWEKWKEALFLAEALYSGFDEGELYQSFSAQSIPDSELSAEGFDKSTGQEVLTWKVECPTGYGRVRWVISPVTVEHSFPSSEVQDWRESLSISLYESKNAYEVLMESF